MVRKAVIIINWLYDFDNQNYLIGGIETYIQDLSKLLDEMNYKVTIYQLSERQNDLRSCIENGIIIQEIATRRNHKSLTFNQIFEEAYFPLNKLDLMIIPRDTFKIKKYPSNVIIIQHGISFDFPGTELHKIFQITSFTRVLRKIMYCLQQTRLTDKCTNLVCVDYNFFNWYRTIGTIDSHKNFVVIPNYSSKFITEVEFDQKMLHRKQKKIVFARRFTHYRGTLVFLNVVKKLVIEFPNVEVTFAGVGPLESIIEEATNEYTSIKLTSYIASNSVDFHKQFDIAVVPTLFSEGTSLSICEAMAAGCFPIATHVGGLTNLIIDNFNGRLCYPDEESIYDVLKDVILMEDEEFLRITRNAYNSARQSFSLEIWRKKWMKYLYKLAAEIET